LILSYPNGHIICCNNVESVLLFDKPIPTVTNKIK
jgi:hypothetical protein